MSRGKVFLGISGGIDSAASVFRLREMGYDVVGVYLQLQSKLENKNELENTLGIKIIVKELSVMFKNIIIDNFIDSYINGEVPSPCVECNDKIKWQIISDVAKEHGAELWATGHYCNKIEIDGKFYVTKGIDPIKDQSYYLWRLNQDILKGAIFPLGDITKESVYSYMQENGHHYLVKKKQSMGICFLGGKSCGDYLRQNIPNIELLKGGDIISSNGDVVGKHEGYPFYTLAQRKGLEIEKGQCVVSIDKNLNQLTIGKKEQLFSSTIHIKDWIIHNIKEVISSNKLRTVVRGIGENPLGYSQIEITSPSTATITLDNPAWAVTKGQPIVLYIDNRVVGGGYVK